MEPAILFLEQENLNYILMEFSLTSDFKMLREKLEKQWIDIMPSLPFECVTLDDYWQNTLGMMNKIAGFFNIIGIIAIFFSSLGLFGLASFMVERRTKEIGIRKVLGAGFNRIFWTIIREYMILIIVANIVGLLIIYLVWNRLLQTGLLFITGIGAEIYVSVVLTTITLAVLAVASQTVRAAISNPVDALRHE